MTHDFHYYITFMCARNAGFTKDESRQIALCADGVDGGDPVYAKEHGDGYKTMKSHLAESPYRPLTVYNVGDKVNMTHSLGGSIASIPWMAFHFLPSLEVRSDKLTVDGNNYSIVRQTPGRKTPMFALKDNPRTSKQELLLSQVLENGLICTQNSIFAKKLIKNTAEEKAKIANPTERFAFLGVRAHIIADLFAHEGFAGCRSVNVNALVHANTLNEEARAKNQLFCLAYTLARTQAAGASIVKDLKIARLGHGQAGQRPDEPFVKFSFKRAKGEGDTLVKDNYDLFGRAFMAVTEALKGRDEKRLGSKYKEWYKFEDEEGYLYKWKQIRPGMNSSRENRRLFLRQLVLSTENEGTDTNDGNFFDLGLHDGGDYWAFGKMNNSLLQLFSKAANKHLKWFHRTFFELSGCTIDQYMQVSVLWPFQDDDDWHAIEINQALISTPDKAIELKGTHGSTGATLSGTQIGTHYMDSKIFPELEKRKVAETLKPSDVYYNMADSPITF